MARPPHTLPLHSLQQCSLPWLAHCLLAAQQLLHMLASLGAFPENFATKLEGLEVLVVLVSRPGRRGEADQLLWQ